MNVRSIRLNDAWVEVERDGLRRFRLIIHGRTTKGGFYKIIATIGVFELRSIARSAWTIIRAQRQTWQEIQDGFDRDMRGHE